MCRLCCFCLLFNVIIKFGICTVILQSCSLDLYAVQCPVTVQKNSIAQTKRSYEFLPLLLFSFLFFLLFFDLILPCRTLSFNRIVKLAQLFYIVFLFCFCLFKVKSNFYFLCAPNVNLIRSFLFVLFHLLLYYLRLNVILVIGRHNGIFFFRIW